MIRRTPINILDSLRGVYPRDFRLNTGLPNILRLGLALAVQVLYGLAALRGMLGRNLGMETCVRLLSQEDYGELSRGLRSAIEMTEQEDISLRDAIREAAHKVKSRYARQALEAISSALTAPDPRPIIELEATRIQDDVEQRLKSFVEGLFGMAEAFFLVSFLLPLMMLSIVFLSVVLSGAGAFLALPSLDPALIAQLTLATLVIALAAILLITWKRGRIV